MNQQTSSKITDGNFFEDFVSGQIFHNAIPRTVSEGDIALYIALTGDRRPLHCSTELGRTLGFRREIAHDLLQPGDLPRRKETPHPLPATIDWGIPIPDDNP